MTRNMRDRLKGSTFHQGRCRSPPRECSTVQRDGLALLEENRMGRLGSSSSPSAAGWARARPQGGGCRFREAQRNSLSARTAPAAGIHRTRYIMTPAPHSERRRATLAPLPSHETGNRTPFQVSAHDYRTWGHLRSGNDASFSAASFVAGPVSAGRKGRLGNVVLHRPAAKLAGPSLGSSAGIEVGRWGAGVVLGQAGLRAVSLAGRAHRRSGPSAYT